MVLELAASRKCDRVGTGALARPAERSSAIRNTNDNR
jgi:hypothetical protein